MTLLNISVLTNEAKELFDVLCKASELKGLTLMGGTALALQIGHRTSLDFDFACFDGQIPSSAINKFIARLKEKGFNVHEVTDPQKESQFRINTGESLRNCVRDYIINNVKVTFFAHGKNKLQQEFYSHAEKIQSPGMSYTLMGLEGLKVSKILVLADRVQSRDLYDLMILIKYHDYSIEKAMSTVKEIGHLDDPEHYRAVMIGEIPRDQNDTGLMPVGVEISMSDIYEYFESQFEIHDIKKATELFSSKSIDH